jgi:hypothetical protein
MFSVDETTAEAIRHVFDESGELFAVVEPGSPADLFKTAR